MRKVTTWLAVAFCTFALGFATAALWLAPRRHIATETEAPCSHQRGDECALALDSDTDLFSSARLPILDYCELMSRPDRYSGKIVRIRAGLGGFIHGILFADNKNCSGQTAVGFPESNEDVRRALTEAAGSEWYGHVPLDLIVVGKFEKVKPSLESDAIWATAEFRFVIMRVEKASKAH